MQTGHLQFLGAAVSLPICHVFPSGAPEHREDAPAGNLAVHPPIHIARTQNASSIAHENPRG